MFWEAKRQRCLQPPSLSSWLLPVLPEPETTSALADKLPAPPQKCKKCPQCEVTKERSEFALTQWGLPRGICLQRRPVDERLQRRAKPKKVCCKCKVECPREAFSKSQWDAGAASACSVCVAASALALQKRLQNLRRGEGEGGVFQNTVAAAFEDRVAMQGVFCHEGGRASTSFRCRAFS